MGLVAWAGDMARMEVIGMVVTTLCVMIDVYMACLGCFGSWSWSGLSFAEIPFLENLSVI